MDVHDCGSYVEPAEVGQTHERKDPLSGETITDRPSRILRPGMALTIEPGLYVRPSDRRPERVLEHRHPHRRRRLRHRDRLRADHARRARDRGQETGRHPHRRGTAKRPLRPRPAPACPPGAARLPFVWESTGIETHFTNGLDPEPRARAVFAFFRPELLVQWLIYLPTPAPADAATVKRAPGTFLARMRPCPSWSPMGQRRRALCLWPAQISAITNLEKASPPTSPRP
jgi:hypothetical protein